MGSGTTVHAAEFAVHRDLISSWWTVVVLGLVTLLAVALSFRGRAKGADGRRPHRLRSWSLRAGALVSLVLAVGVGLNAYVGYIPDVEALRLRFGLGSDRPAVTQPSEPAPVASDARVSTITDPAPEGVGAAGAVQIPAPATMKIPSDEAWVYTPPGYDPSGATLYPTMYLLHGSPGTAADWMTSGAPGVLDQLITSGTIRPMIVVSPDMNAEGTDESSCLDSTKGGSQVESYLTDVVIPWVDEHYPVAQDRVYRSIGGMSSGAYCAIDQGLRHDDLYGTILAIMPYGEPGAGGDHQLSTPEEVAEHTPNTYVDTIALPDHLGVLFDYGDGEKDSEVGVTARDLAARLEARGATVVLREEAGQGHTWGMAMTALPYGAQLFEQQMAASEAKPAG